MRICGLISLFLFSSILSFGQVGIGIVTPAATLDVVSNTSGFLIPRIIDHTTLTPSLGVDEQGMQVYNTSTNSIWSWSGTHWTEFVAPNPFSPFFVSVSALSVSTNQYGPALTNYEVLTVNDDLNGAYNTTTGFITLPSDGIYQITATLRVRDFSPVNTIFGIGVHTATVDGPWFQRHITQNTLVPFRRSSYPYVRVARYNAGDQLRMFVNFDGSSPAFM